jgi:hypothetical protein
MDPDSLSINIQHCPAAVTVNHRTNRVALIVCNANVMEIDDGTKSQVYAVCAISQPNCALSATKVEAKISKPIIDPFPDNVAIIPLGLTYHCENGEVSHKRRSFIGWQ